LVIGAGLTASGAHRQRGRQVVSVGVTTPQHRADLFLDPAADPREGGPRLGDERTTLNEFLRCQRLTLELKCDGLDPEQLARRAVEPSTMSLLGLIRHMAEVERSWFRRRFAGLDVPKRYQTEALFIANGQRANGSKEHQYPELAQLFETIAQHLDWGGNPNLARRMVRSAINQLWVADITYIRLQQEFIYLAVILDVYSRRVVSWSIGRQLDSRIAQQALETALKQRQPEPGLIHHSDRGVQYACGDYVKRLEGADITISMSRPGNPWDNAWAESFMKTLKVEEVDGRRYRNLDHATSMIGSFIEEIYNEQRLHSALDYLSPVEFEAQIAEISISTKKEKRTKKERKVRKGRPVETATAVEIRKRWAFGDIFLNGFPPLFEKASAQNALAFSQFQQVRRRLT